MRLIVIKYLQTLKNKLEKETFGSTKVRDIINHIDIIVRFLKIL